MTKTKSTKRSLLMSALALLMCVSMLVGSTFAWFTDSVVSGSNVIKSGNLDIDVQYTLDGKNWNDLDGANDLFQKGLWEPGHTEVVALKISNEGTLALKYAANMNIISETVGTNKEGKDIVLSDILTVSTLTQQANDAYGVGDITLMLAYQGENSVAYENTTSFKAGNVLKADQELFPGDAHYLFVKVDMAETVGNEANAKDKDSVPSINFGINVLATQYTFESDSFGNQYDVAAPWLGTVPAKLPATLVIEPSIGDQTGTITIKSPDAFVYLNTLAKEWVSLYSNGQSTSVDSYRETVGGKGTDYYYHWTWDIKLATDLDMSNIPMDSVDISYWGNFDGNGHTISNVVLKNGQDGLFNNGAKAINNLTVKNIIVNAPEAQTVGAVAGNGAMTNVYVENATVNGGKYVGGICGKGSSFTNCSIKDATVTASDKTVGGLVGYSVGDPNAATVSGNTVENVTVIGTYNVGGMLGQSQNETVENNTVKNVTVISTAAVPADASSNEVRTAKVAARSAFANTTVGANTIVEVTEVNAATNAAELKEAINSGATYIYAQGVELDTKLNLGSKKTATFVDCTFTGNSAWGYANNATFVNCTFDSGSDNAAIHFDRLYGDLVVENCTFKSGKVQIGTNGNATATFTNCEFAETASTSIWAEKGMRFYCPTTFNNCEFNNRVVVAGSNGLELTFGGCTMNGGTPVYYVDNTDGIIRGGNIPVITIK